MIGSPEAGAWSYDGRGFGVERRTLAPAQAAEVTLDRHHACFQLSGPSWREDRDDGRTRQRRLDRGDLTLRPAGVPATAEWADPVEVLMISLEPWFVTRAGRGRDLRDTAYVGADSVSTGVADALAAALATSGGIEPLMIDSLVIGLCAHLTARHGAGRRSTGGVRPLTSAEVDRVRDLINVDPAARLSLADLAGTIPLSPQYFARAFRASTGTSPHEFVMARRLERACERLRTSTLTVDAVARATGFTDRAHLARRLRASSGLAPLELRSRRAPRA